LTIGSNGTSPPVHVPAAHVSPVGHVVPHPPQFFGSDEPSTSHPSDASLLQSRKLPVHAYPHEPVEHVGTEFGCVAHTVPQPPQLLGSIAGFTHGPEGAGQQMSGTGHAHPVQVPPLHTPPGPQFFPHAPQFLGSVRRFASHPSDAMPSQSANGFVHEKPHADALHVAVECGGAPHAVEQLPQWSGSRVVSSQFVGEGQHV
jgi:hypothetical protein